MKKLSQGYRNLQKLVVKSVKRKQNHAKKLPAYLMKITRLTPMNFMFDIAQRKMIGLWIFPKHNYNENHGNND